jgi:Tat protein translocase TatB subunit
MFGSIGGFEMLVLLVIGLLVFGPRRLPEIGRTLGKAMVEFRRAAMELRSSIEKEINLEELKDASRAVSREVHEGVRSATQAAENAIPQEIRDLKEIKPIDLGTEPRKDDVAEQD